MVYSTSTYNYAKDEVLFFIAPTTTQKSISRSKFCKLLGLPTAESLGQQLVNPDTLDPTTLMAMINDLGYDFPLTVPSSMTKSKLPNYWNFFFTILIRCLGERSTSSESLEDNS